MKPAARLALAALMVLGALVGAALPAQASGAPWLFNGTFVWQGRGFNEIKFSGDLAAPSGPDGVRFEVIMVAASATNPSAGGYECTNRITLNPSQTKFIEGACRIEKPGTYVLAVYIYIGFYGGCYVLLDDCGRPTVPVTGPPAVAVSLPTSEVPVTRLSADKIVQGSAVTVTAVNEVHWSDGVVTDETLPEDEDTADLQQRTVGSSVWKTVASGSTRFTGRPITSVELRFLFDGSPTSAVLLTVTAPTSKQRFIEAGGPGKPVFAGTPLRLTYALQSLYDDSEWRPTPRQAVTVQFSPRKNGPWQNMANGWVNKGEGQKTVTANTTGYWRVRTPTATSASFYVKVRSR
ncbi:MAG: hypothetical protein QG597_2235 [Actinomycetota bacterium]|nr:hypothetical protein [Actinomycetota bacterium]